jgi:hypothetical protein
VATFADITILATRHDGARKNLSARGDVATMCIGDAASARAAAQNSHEHQWVTLNGGNEPRKSEEPLA